MAVDDFLLHSGQIQARGVLKGDKKDQVFIIEMCYRSKQRMRVWLKQMKIHAELRSTAFDSAGSVLAFLWIYMSAFVYCSP